MLTIKEEYPLLLICALLKSLTPCVTLQILFTLKADTHSLFRGFQFTPMISESRLSLPRFGSILYLHLTSWFNWMLTRGDQTTRAAAQVSV